MTYGLRTKNLTRGNTTIDENLRSYRYLGKYQIPSRMGNYPTVEFTCAGFPQIFHDVPYNITSEDDTSSEYGLMWSRSGLSLQRLDNLGGNRWRATFNCNNFNGPNYEWYMRVFGRLDLNPVAGNRYGLQVKNLDNVVIFDSACRPLRLAGDTYNTEIVLGWEWPQNFITRAEIERYDTFVDVPFNLSGKSICATSRGAIYALYQRGGHYDDGQWMFEFEIAKFHTLYWANGSRLYARRIPLDVSYVEYPSDPIVTTYKLQVVYSRLAVIDNSLFP